MSVYTPNRWLLFNVKDVHNGEEYDLILGGWSGGYTQGSSWRISSNIVKATRVQDTFQFEGASGSLYICQKEGFGVSLSLMEGQSLLLNSPDKFEVTLIDISEMDNHLQKGKP